MCTRAVCGLAHYFEDEGIATVMIALVREHAEQMKPPRALWVPFELGRPLGAPSDPLFQRRVIDAAFVLLDAPEGPLLVDFGEEAPIDAASEEGEEEPWVCPVSFAQPLEGGEKSLADRVKEEIDEMEPWYEQAKARRARTMVGVSEMSLSEAVDFLAQFLEPGAKPVIPAGKSYAELHNAFRYAAEDVKVYYQEAALALPGKPKRGELNKWFFTQTEAGKFLIAVCEQTIHGKDRFTAGMAWGNIVPMALRHLTNFPDELPNYKPQASEG
jgi:hypothetical protein